MSQNTDTKDSSVVYLRTTKDWPRWIAVNRTKAQHRDVWKLIDPDISTPEELVEPEYPKPLNAEGAVVAIHALKPAELESFKIASDDWKTKRKLFDKKKDALNEIEEHVIRTTGNFWSSIEHVQGLHARMVALKDSCGPNQLCARD